MMLPYESSSLMAGCTLSSSPVAAPTGSVCIESLVGAPAVTRTFSEVAAVREPEVKPSL